MYRFLEVFENCISSASLWKSLEYTVATHLEDGTLTIYITCDHCSIVDDFKGHNGWFEELQVEYKFACQKSIDIMCCVRMMNHLTTLMILKLEQRYPLVFSVYGRKYFVLNYRYAKKNIQIIARNRVEDLSLGELYLESTKRLYHQCAQYTIPFVLKSTNQKFKHYDIPPTSPLYSKLNITHIGYTLQLLDPESFMVGLREQSHVHSSKSHYVSVS